MYIYIYIYIIVLAQEIVPAAPLWKRRSRALSAMAATDSGLSGLPGLGDAPSVQKEVVGPSIATSTSSIAPRCANYLAGLARRRH